MTELINYLTTSLGMAPDAAAAFAAKLMGPQMRNEIEIGPATVTPIQKVEIGEATVTPNWPPQWAPRPQHPRDREQVGRTAQAVSGLMDSFGAMSKPDTASGYRQRSRENNDIYGAASQYQPHAGFDTLLRFAEATGIVPAYPGSREEYQRKVKFIDTHRPKGGN
ncbi:MAG: hypothetical protein H0W42_11335 [Gemmatimonadaceae bacterium]|nr:hypothetical protein [Gemmatimonadaceae bacterium]